jgi:hypothetical protein
MFILIRDLAIQMESLAIATNGLVIKFCDNDTIASGIKNVNLIKELDF